MMNDNIKIPIGIHKLSPEVKIPSYATSGAACFDIRLFLSNTLPQMWEMFSDTPTEKQPSLKTSDTNCSITIDPGDRVLLPTGIIMDIPSGYSVRLHSRSGLAVKHGLMLTNGEGVIDSDYVGEIMVAMTNISDTSVCLNEGDRICQAEIVPVLVADFQIIQDRPQPKCDRTGGFGSTGVK